MVPGPSFPRAPAGRHSSEALPPGWHPPGRLPASRAGPPLPCSSVDAPPAPRETRRAPGCRCPLPAPPGWPRAVEGQGPGGGLCLPREVALCPFSLGRAQSFTMPLGNFLLLSFGNWILGRYWLVFWWFFFVCLRVLVGLFLCNFLSEASPVLSSFS